MTKRSDTARMLTLAQAAAYCGLGRTTAFRWLQEINAKVVYTPKCVRYDRLAIDKALDEMRQAAGEAENAG